MSWFAGVGCRCDGGAGPAGAMEWCLNQPSPGEPSLMVIYPPSPSCHASPPFRIFQNVIVPRHRRGIRHSLPRGLVLGRGEGADGVPESDGDPRSTPPI